MIGQATHFALSLARNARVDVAWGHGPRVGVGMHLAPLNKQCFVRALVAQFDRIEVGTPQPFLSNVQQSFKARPASFH